MAPYWSGYENGWTGIWTKKRVLPLVNGPTIILKPRNFSVLTNFFNGTYINCFLLTDKKPYQKNWSESYCIHLLHTTLSKILLAHLVVVGRYLFYFWTIKQPFRLEKNLHNFVSIDSKNRHNTRRYYLLIDTPGAPYCSSH